MTMSGTDVPKDVPEEICYEAVQQTADAVYITDTDGTIEYVNPAFEDITGYERDEALGETPQILNSGEYDDSFYEELWETVTAGEQWETELVDETKCGDRIILDQTISPITTPDGEVEKFVAVARDVTDRKERERRLETHELIVQTMNEVAFLVDDEKRIQFANDAALDFADVSLETIKGVSVKPITEEMAAPDEDPQRFLDAIESLLAGEEPDVGEWVRGPDGTETLSLEFDLFVDSVGEVYAEQRFVPVDFYDGNQGVVVISRDVTRQREKEQEIQTHLVQAQEVGHVGSWYLKLDNNELQWSDECYRIFGLEPGTPMAYERFLDLVYPEDREKVDDAWNDAIENGSYDIEHRIVVDGEIRWVHETAEVEFTIDGEPTSGIGVVRDITDQVQKEREIRAQKRRYESLFNSIGGAIVVTDPDGRISTCNPGVTDLFGYDIDEIEGDSVSTLTANGAELNQLLAKTGFSQKSVAVDYQKMSGQVFPGQSHISPLQGHDDYTGGYLIHIIDISEQQENRKQLEVLGRILRHNVKNDMSVIISQAELIQKHGSSSMRFRAEKILEKSHNFIEMAKNQQRITELLAGQTEPTDLDLSPITNRAVSDLRKQYPDATLTADLATECQARTIHEIADAIRELIQNAIIHSEQQNPSVEIQLRCTETNAEIEIRDDGPGIPEQESNVLTESGEINPLHHGTGLGLWFVNQVVRHSNGTLLFEKNASKGSTVVVRLPTD
ncbi:MAG: PAS domain S-box protein [Haloarculaceae archaeon]